VPVVGNYSRTRRYVSSCEQSREGDVEQRDAADEGRLEPYGSIIVGNKVIVNQGEVVRPSQLIASVRRTRCGSVEKDQGKTVARRRAFSSALVLMRAGASWGERPWGLGGIAALMR
jgi:hypothetical protein